MMAEVSLLDREREVERARANLAQDLSVLCSPETFAAFTDDLKQEAWGTRDELWEKLKARAAANPAAVMAIGAGLAWWLIQRPPIASALIGVGLFSLWKTEAKPAPAEGTRPRYLRQSKESLREQAGDVFSAAADIASQAQETVSAKGSEVWANAKEKMREWGEEAGRTVGDTTSRLRSSGAAFLGDIRAKQDDLRDQVHDAAAKAVDKVRDDDVRNNVLLGVAGVAVAAALGIACQKRISE
jgi:ElaB/YqjD/DUF883 family membrane-anchored ribosome-binding protein